MKVGVRNQIEGEVINIKKGGVMAQVQVRISGNSTMDSVMTIDSFNDLGIKIGDKVKVAAKAVNVILMKD